MRKKSRSWFFRFRRLWPNNPKERKFANGLVTGALAVTFLTLLLLLFFSPSIPGELRGVKRFGGEICEENACFAYELPPPISPGCVPGPRTACVEVTLRVVASRRIVVDEEENILRIFSNTGLEHPDFKIFAAYQDVGGKEFSLTNRIKEQYQKLEPKINWAKKGLMYEYEPNLVNRALSAVQTVWKRASDSVKQLKTKKISANIN